MASEYEGAGFCTGSEPVNNPPALSKLPLLKVSLLNPIECTWPFLFVSRSCDWQGRRSSQVWHQKYGPEDLLESLAGSSQERPSLGSAAG